MAADPYAILGISRDASEKDVKSAYRRLAKELHPDRNTDNPKAAERFSEVTRAYDLLSDKNKRARFDRGEIDIDGNPTMDFGFGGGGHGRAGGRGFRQEDFRNFGGGENIDIGDILGGMFGGGGGGGGGFGGSPFGRGAPQRGRNTQYRLSVPFAEAATSAPQRITLGDGKTIELKLPLGVEDGTQVRLAGKGERGPAGAGDAIVTLAIQPHAFFRRDGDNILLDLPVTLDEAVHGGKVKVPTVDGPVMLTVAPGSSSGRTLRLKGRGFTRKDGTRGDQMVTIEIALPEADAELVRRLEGWRDPRDVRQKLGV